MVIGFVGDGFGIVLIIGGRYWDRSDMKIIDLRGMRGNGVERGGVRVNECIELMRMEELVEVGE